MGSPDPEYARGYSAIFVFIQALFNYAKSLDSADWQIFAGMGFYVKTPLPPDGLTDTARARNLGLGTKYVSLVQNKVAVSSDGQGGVTAFRFCQSRLELADKSRVHAVPSFHIKRRADLVLDDATELLASDFPYTNVATTMADSLRQRVYGASLSAVKPPVDTSNGGFFDNGSLFYAAAANDGTYDTAAEGQPYYQKWLTQKPATPKDREFKLDLLSDRYLQLNCIPYDLQKGFVHLYLELGDIALLARLYFDDKGGLTYDGILLRGVPQVGNCFEHIAIVVQKLKAQKQAVRGKLWFVYSLEGTSGRPPAFAQLTNVVSANLSLNISEQVVDPKWVVQTARGRKLEDIDVLQRTWTARDWLREMVRLRFSEPWVWFWNNAYLERFYQLDRDKLFLGELRREAAKATGPVKDTLDGYIKAANADPSMYMVKRGSGFGKGIKVVGADDAYIYFYNNSLGIVTRLPMASFWASKDLQQLADEIYQNTKGLIPFCKVVVWGGLIVMGWGIIGTEALVEGFRHYARKYVVEKIESLALDKLIAETFKRFRLRILALLIVPVLDVLGRRLFGDSPVGARIFAFLEGLVEGFTEHAFEAIIHRWESVLTLEPASYRTVKLLMRIEGILRWVDEKMSALKAYLDKTVAKLLMNRFVSIAVQAGTGMIGIINHLYFLDYANVKGILALYAELAEVPMPTEADWDRWRHRHMLETFKQYEDAIKEAGTDVAELYTDAQAAVEKAMTVVKITEYTVGVAAIANAALAGKLIPIVFIGFKKAAGGASWVGKTKPVKIAAGAAALTALGALTEHIATTSDEELLEELTGFAGEFGKAADFLGSSVQAGASFAATTAQFAWAKPERMRRFGQLIGVIMASITISRAVIQKGKWQERWKTRTSTKSFVAKEQLRNMFLVNPWLPGIKLALFQYVRLVEEVIPESHDAWEKFESSVEKTLLGLDDDDSDLLKGIVEEDKGITLPRLIKILTLANHMLTTWLGRLSKVPGLTQQISVIRHKIETIAPNKMPTLDQIRTGKMDGETWVREALMYVMLTHLQGALSWLLKSLEQTLAPVGSKPNETVNVAFLLQTLGFNLGEADALAALDQNFDDAFKATAT